MAIYLKCDNGPSVTYTDQGAAQYCNNNTDWSSAWQYIQEPEFDDPTAPITLEDHIQLSWLVILCLIAGAMVPIIKRAL